MKKNCSFTENKNRDRELAKEWNEKLHKMTNPELVEFLSRPAIDERCVQKRIQRGQNRWMEYESYDDWGTEKTTTKLSSYWYNMKQIAETSKHKYNGNLTEKQRMFCIKTYLITFYGYYPQ